MVLRNFGTFDEFPAPTHPSAQQIWYVMTVVSDIFVSIR